MNNTKPQNQQITQQSALINKSSQLIQVQPVLENLESEADVQTVNSELAQRTDAALTVRVLQLIPEQDGSPVCHVQQQGSFGQLAKILCWLRVELGEDDDEPARQVDAELTTAVLAEPTVQDRREYQYQHSSYD
jgi:hypothetical protein